MTGLRVRTETRQMKVLQFPDIAGPGPVGQGLQGPGGQGFGGRLVFPGQFPQEIIDQQRDVLPAVS